MTAGSEYKHFLKNDSAVVVAMETILIFAILSIVMVGVYLAINNLNNQTTEDVMREELTALGHAVGREIVNMNSEIDSSFSRSHQLTYQKTLRIPRTVANTPYSITINSSSVVLESTTSPYMRVVVPMRYNLPVFETTIYSTAGQPVIAFHDQSGMLYFSNNGTTPPIDDIAPTVNITSPPNGSTVSNTTTITVSATDNVAVTKVEYYVDGILNATRTTSYDWSWDTTTLTNENHTVTARAYDRVFQFSEDTHVYYVLNTDTNPPTITSYSPAGTLTQYENNTQNVIIYAEYTDINGIDTSNVTITFDGTPVTANSTVTNESVTYNTSSLSNGTHTVSTNVSDVFGNSVMFQWDFDYLLLPDSTAPLLNITSPLANTTHEHGETITATFEAQDNESGLDYVMVNVTNSSGARITPLEERVEFNGETTAQSGQVWMSSYAYDSSQAPYNITLSAYNMNTNSTTKYVNGLTVAGEIIILVSNSTSGGHHDKVKFKVKNNGTSMITLDKMNLTWTDSSARIKEIKAKSPDVKVWKWDGSEGVSPHGSGTSTVDSGTLIDIDNLQIGAGSQREFEAKFEKDTGGNIDMRGNDISVTFILSDGSEHTVSFNT